MGTEIRYPNIKNATEREMIAQVRSYLYQLVDQLNFTLDSMGASNTGQATNNNATKDASKLFSEIKPLIVKSADIAKAIYVFALKFKGDEIPNNTDIDKLTEPHRYFGNKNAGYKNLPVSNAEEFVLEVSAIGNGKTVQMLTCVSASDEVYKRQRIGNAWGEWEVENPQMIAGKEYLTTERYQGKEVYTAIIGLGNLPNASSKLVSHGLDATWIVRCIGQTSKGASLPYRYDNDSNWASICADPTHVILASGDDKSNVSAYAQIWYTKD